MLARHGVATPRGEAVSSTAEAVAVARRLGGRVVVKAQIHAGGRGKGGGVKLADTADDVGRIAREILGMTLVTAQTGPGGQVVSRLLVEEGLDITNELYLGLLIDRTLRKLAFRNVAKNMRQQVEASIDCPYCGEALEILIDDSLELQRYIEDCRVCCRPIDLTVQCVPGLLPTVAVGREDDI